MPVEALAFEHKVYGGGNTSGPLPPSQQSFMSRKAWTVDKLTPKTETLKFSIPTVSFDTLRAVVSAQSPRPDFGPHNELFDQTVNKLRALPEDSRKRFGFVHSESSPSLDAHSRKINHSDVRITKHDNGTSSVEMKHHIVEDESLSGHYNRLRSVGVPETVNVVRTAALASNKAVRHMATIVMRHPAMSSIVGFMGLGMMLSAASGGSESHRKHHHHHHSDD